MPTINKPDFTSLFSTRSLDVNKFLQAPEVKQALAQAPDADKNAAAAFPRAVVAAAAGGTISTPQQAASLFAAIDTLDHNGDTGSVDSPVAMSLIEQAKQYAVLQQRADPIPTTLPGGTTSAGEFMLGSGAQPIAVLSTFPKGASNPFHSAPFGQPLKGLKDYSQITVGGQTAAKFHAKADYDADGSGATGATDQLTTSLTFNDGRKGINGEKVPYIVLPPEIVHTSGAKLGDLVQVTFRGASTFAIFADGGPHGKAGELSGATARAAGIVGENGKPINGNMGRDTQDVAYTVLVNSGRPMGILPGGNPVTADDIQTKGGQAFAAAQSAGVFA